MTKAFELSNDTILLQRYKTDYNFTEAMLKF